jgi:3alpha(or 20beta)-hydroxysteroid dehydrogenase
VDRTRRRLEGKVALITGAARGQGEAEARLFVAEGARVVLGDVRDERGEKVAASLGEAARYVPLDVAREEQWQRAVALAESEFGRLDILVNNAGVVGEFCPIELCDLESYQRTIAVNQIGPFLGMKTAIPALRRAGGGSIVNVCSVAGLYGIPGLIAYGASKWALRGMTKVVALEVGKDNIRVNALHPGSVETPMMARDLDRAVLVRGQALERVAQPEEMASAALFLASDESAFITGADLAADAGLSAGQAIQGLTRR